MTKQNYPLVTKSHITFALQRFNQDTFCFDINEVHNTQVDKKVFFLTLTQYCCWTKADIALTLGHIICIPFFKKFYT